jgi:hypothetical protein
VSTEEIGMPYQLPADIEAALTVRVRDGGYDSIEQVLRTAIDALDYRDAEIAAIQEGIDAMERGDVQSFEEFDREFRRKNNIPLDA